MLFDNSIFCTTLDSSPFFNKTPALLANTALTEEETPLETGISFTTSPFFRKK